MPFCPNCGKRSDDGNLCDECEKTLREQEINAKEVMQRLFNLLGIVFIIMLFVGVPIYILTYVFSDKDGGESEAIVSDGLNIEAMTRKKLIGANQLLKYFKYISREKELIKIRLEDGWLLTVQNRKAPGFSFYKVRYFREYLKNTSYWLITIHYYAYPEGYLMITDSAGEPFPQDSLSGLFPDKSILAAFCHDLERRDLLGGLMICQLASGQLAQENKWQYEYGEVSLGGPSAGALIDHETIRMIRKIPPAPIPGERYCYASGFLDNLAYGWEMTLNPIKVVRSLP